MNPVPGKISFLCLSYNQEWPFDIVLVIEMLGKSFGKTFALTIKKGLFTLNSDVMTGATVAILLPKSRKNIDISLILLSYFHFH